MALAYANQSTGDLVASVGVLALAADRDEVLGILEDERCALSGGGFVDANGDYYVLGDSGDGAFDIFGVVELPEPCLVRLPRGADAFDPDFVLRVASLVGAPQVAGLVGRGDRTFLTRTLDPRFDLTTITNPLDYFRIEAWIWQAVSVDDGTAIDLGLPPSGISFAPFVVDGDFYVQQLDEDTQRSTLVRFDGTTTSPSFTVTGDIQRVARIR